MNRLITLLIATLITVPLFAQTSKTKDFSKVYSEKKFYFSGWGEPNRKTTKEEQLTTLGKWAEAGITDLLPSVGIDRLKELIELGSKQNIKIHAWHWMMNVGGSEECRAHPEWYSVNALGQSCRDFHPYVNYYNFLSPFSEGAREYIKKGVREKAKIKGLASVHFDYIRYVDVILGNNLQKKYPYKGGKLKQDRILPDYDFGYHPNARKQFEEAFGIDPMDIEDRAENPAWQQFRMNAISSLVNECVEICHEEGTASSAAVFPFPQLAREYVRQDWAHWNLDYFFPMIYKEDHDGNMGWVEFATKEGVREMKEGKHLFVGILVGDYGDNLQDFEQAIVQAHKNGARGITFFTINSLNEAQLAIIKKYNEKFNK
ncbi:family 10 glycosylhydrolase [Prolixibacteraceae bacterium Z1-6]|uniref:Family 10 glycosylhydrolase n=1 Tax=Draconibacterium aestuarii TaxID=2998507 RepID=A0A9X3J930_9BACT|nr:family 10 glycosylhydrolase [Prolixibacteraceae bacterium Z1-6]